MRQKVFAAAQISITLMHAFLRATFCLLPGRPLSSVYIKNATVYTDCFDFLCVGLYVCDRVLSDVFAVTV